MRPHLQLYGGHAVDLQGAEINVGGRGTSRKSFVAEWTGTKCGRVADTLATAVRMMAVRRANVAEARAVGRGV